MEKRLKTIGTLRLRHAANLLVLGIIGISLSAQAQSPQLVSVRGLSAASSASGNGPSAAPVISYDGRYIVFASAANDLVPGCRDSWVNLYRLDRSNNTLALITVSSNGVGGGNGNSAFGKMSTNGQFVVFESRANNLVPGDTNRASDVFLRDMVSGTTTLVSMGTNGAPGYGDSTDPTMTPDGRYIAFVSRAANLAPGMTFFGEPWVFVRDMVLGVTMVASPGAYGTSYEIAQMGMPVITPVGRYVAFSSTCGGLHPSVPSNARGDIYVRDLQTSTTIWASTNARSIAQANGAYLDQCDHPCISSDGRYVAFRMISSARNSDVMYLRHDTLTATTAVVHINVSSNGAARDYSNMDEDSGPEMSVDGRYIFFVSRDVQYSNVLSSSVYRWDAQSGATVLVSTDGTGVPASTLSFAPVIEPYGRFVLFLSNATNLVPDAVPSGFHIYRRDMFLRKTKLVDVSEGGVGPDPQTMPSFSLSANGQWIAFSSSDSALVEEDRNGVSDVVARDIVHGTNQLVSRGDPTLVPQSADGWGSISPVTISADGRWLAFDSSADDLVPDDTNGLPDVFAADLVTGNIDLVSVGMDGGTAAGGYSIRPVISGNGRYVAFVSGATNLINTSTNYMNVFLRDLWTGTTRLVSVATDGFSLANDDCTDPVISYDGQHVAFLSGARNLMPYNGFPSAYLRHMDRQTNTLLCRVSTPGEWFPPAVSLDCRYVAEFGNRRLFDPYWNQLYWELNSRLFVWDSQLDTYIYTNAGVSTIDWRDLDSFSLSPDGRRILYRLLAGTNANTTFIDDVFYNTNIFWAMSVSTPLRNSQRWSADGRFLAYVATTNFPQLFLYDFESNSATLIHPELCKNANDNGMVDSPVVSSDGRFVLYRAWIDPLTSATNPAPFLYAYDRIAGTHSLLQGEQPGASPVSWISRPVISASGNRMAFLSTGALLVEGDFNAAPDVFSMTLDIGLPLDSDGDGIPDWWTSQYFGHATGQGNDLSRAEDDADNDGMNNREEWIAGTYPTSYASRLLLVDPMWSQSGFTMNWPSVNGLLYYVQRMDDWEGQAAFSTIQSNIVGQTLSTTFTDTNSATGGPFFYRVGVQ